MLSDGLKLILLWVAAIAVAIALGLGVLWLNRRTAPYAEETRKITHDTSRAYQQGTQLNIAQWCREMRTKPEHAPALAAMIREAAATYTGPLSADNQTCINEAQGL